MAQTPLETHLDISAPTEDQQSAKLSHILLQIFDPNRPPTAIGTVADELEHHGMAIILILFSLPSALPVPAPGYSTILSVPLLIIGVSLILGKESIWLPERVRTKTFDPADFQKLKFLMLRMVARIERICRPRLRWLITSKSFSRVLGVIVCLLAFFMALPIPGTNTLPAGGIFLIGFGLLESDGL
ncbi:MAG: exopolysaccharide biosynthesis protein, partial [Bdellovibrionales bacterium]|nr:exopolysaccharide biosynthesis protein [Bdellovibrionales bacterium]